MKTIMYNTKPGLVNGNIIQDLLDICNDQFITSFFQRSGSSVECMYCGYIRERSEIPKHSENCPVIKYEKIVEKHKKFIRWDV